MKLCSVDTPSVREVIDILSAAGRTIAPRDRVLISATSHSTVEGLALLTAYTSIEDPIVRQAFLDLAIMLGGPSD